MHAVQGMASCVLSDTAQRAVQCAPVRCCERRNAASHTRDRVGKRARDASCRRIRAKETLGNCKVDLNVSIYLTSA